MRSAIRGGAHWLPAVSAGGRGGAPRAPWRSGRGAVAGAGRAADAGGGRGRGARAPAEPRTAPAPRGSAVPERRAQVSTAAALSASRCPCAPPAPADRRLGSGGGPGTGGSPHPLEQQRGGGASSPRGSLRCRRREAGGRPAPPSARPLSSALRAPAWRCGERRPLLRWTCCCPLPWPAARGCPWGSGAERRCVLSLPLLLGCLGISRFPPFFLLAARCDRRGVRQSLQFPVSVPSPAASPRCPGRRAAPQTGALPPRLPPSLRPRQLSPSAARQSWRLPVPVTPPIFRFPDEIAATGAEGQRGRSWLTRTGSTEAAGPPSPPLRAAGCQGGGGGGGLRTAGCGGACQWKHGGKTPV